MEQQLAALIRQDPRARQPAPEKGSLAARVRELEQRAQGELDPAAAHALDGEIGEAFEDLNDEVRELAAGRDQFETYGPRPVEVDEQLLERARSNSRNLTAEEAGQFEAQLNAAIGALAADPSAARPALPAPAAPTKPAAKPAGQSGDPLAGVDPAVLLAALDKLGVDQQTLAGLVAGDDDGGT
jgi:hypothetical protein